MNPIFSNPELQNLITALLTLALAWIKRKRDLRKIKKAHQEEVFQTKVHYEGRIASLKDRLNQTDNETHS